MGNISVTPGAVPGPPPLRRHRCYTDSQSSWDCYLQRGDNPCDASELTLSTTTTTTTPTMSCRDRERRRRATTTTTATSTTGRRPTPSSTTTRSKSVQRLRRFFQEQEQLQGVVRKLQTDLDSAMVLLGKQDKLEERVRDLEGQIEKLHLALNKSSSSSKSATVSALKKIVTIQEPAENSASAAGRRPELAKSQSLPVYAVATESL